MNLGVGNPIFDVLLLVHVIIGMVGYFSTSLTSWMAKLFLKEPRHPGLGRYFNGRTNWASRTITLVPVFGLVVAWAGSLWSDFSQAWFIAAIGIWFATAAIVSIFIWPIEKAIYLALQEGNFTDSSQEQKVREQKVKRAVVVGGISSVGYVVAFYLMLFKP